MNPKGGKMKKLFGLGTGPGDPELLTLKAVKILKEANIIFAPLSKGKNMALDTVKEYVKDKEIVYLDFPMGSVTNEVYKENAEIIINNINEGESGVFITIGDPTFYSTFINMLEFLQNKIYAKSFYLRCLRVLVCNSNSTVLMTVIFYMANLICASHRD